MKSKLTIQLLDCTLRDGCYVCDSQFGDETIKKTIKYLESAGAEIIELGWFKDKERQTGSAFFHQPSDVTPFLEKKPGVVYAVMIDWDRYNLDNLPANDSTSIDAIRVVFPHGKHREGIEVGKAIMGKGYKVYFQAANTLAYSDEDLIDLCRCINKTDAVAVSIVDTFGAMSPQDLSRICRVVGDNLDSDKLVGFHAHNNQQMAYALSIQFVEYFSGRRSIIVDSTLCGMGRGAGNTTTELLTNYLNHKGKHYDMKYILRAIDECIEPLKLKFSWGYSTPYFISGAYCAHVNNLAYLEKHHNSSNEDIWKTFSKMSPEDRTHYDYDLLEQAFSERNDC